MSVCKFCHQEMSSAHGCSLDCLGFEDGRAYDRIPVGAEGDALKPAALNDAGSRCSECGAENGAFHHYGCEYETCPICRKPLVECEHAAEPITKVDSMCQSLNTLLDQVSPELLCLAELVLNDRYAMLELRAVAKLVERVSKLLPETCDPRLPLFDVCDAMLHTDCANFLPQILSAGDDYLSQLMIVAAQVYREKMERDITPERETLETLLKKLV